MTYLDPGDGGLHDLLANLGQAAGRPRSITLESSPLLAALKGAGTAHVYADTADTLELRGTLEAGEGRVVAEVDGNTVNQPLVGKVVRRYLESGEAGPRSGGAGSSHLHAHLRPHRPGRCPAVCRRAELGGQPAAPHGPGRRRLGRRGGRPGPAADVTRTNIFMGRLNSGLRAGLLGEQVALEAQRALLRLRREAGVKTLLGDRLYRRFDTAGFADLFHAPSAAEWRLPLDTLYTLLADADFENEQEAIDRQIERYLPPG